MRFFFSWVKTRSSYFDFRMGPVDVGGGLLCDTTTQRKLDFLLRDGHWYARLQPSVSLSLTLDDQWLRLFLTFATGFSSDSAPK